MTAALAMDAHGDSVGAMFATAARDYPQRTFLRWCQGDDRIGWSYAGAALRIEALAARLDALGLAVGDHVVVYTAEMVPSILFDLACACAGVVFTPIETTSIPAVLELCRRCDAKAVLTTPSRRDAVPGIPVIVEDGRGEITGDPAVAIARLLERTARLDRESVYMLQPTSGTTGGSKLVIRHHAPFLRIAMLQAFDLARAAEPAERVLMVPALTHGMGQYQLAIAMRLAAELGVTTKIDVDADLDEIRWLDPTHVALTPRVLRSLVRQRGEATDGRLFGPAARFFICGGAAPDRDLLAAVARSGVHVIEAYGASEISVVAMTRPGHWRADVVGIVLDDVTLRVTDEGELQAQTPVMLRGYHGAPELTRAAFTDDGFYRTGDRVTLGPDGEFRYLGRVVDTFNLFDGSHVAPGPIEDALTRLPWIDQVMLIGDQRPYLIGLVVLHPALRDAGAMRRTIERDLGRICSSLDMNARIRRVAIVDRFPDTVYQVVGHGKVRRKRDDAAKLFAETLQALYGSARPEVVVIDVPGAAAERRAASRQRASWLVRIGTGDHAIVAYTRDVSRGGAFVEHAIVGDQVGASAPISVDVIGLDREHLVLEADRVRTEASGSAYRWRGPADALARLAQRLPP